MDMTWVTTMLCYVVLYCVLLWCVVPCYVMLCHVVLCYVGLSYVVLCYVVLCYVVLSADHRIKRYQIIMFFFYNDFEDDVPTSELR